MKEKFKNCLIAALVCVVIVCLIRLVGKQTEIYQLEQNIEQLEWNIKQLEQNIEQLENTIRYEDVVLDNCPLCDGNAVVKPINDSFYIKCENCDLETNFFDSKSELIKYWNRE